MYPINKYSNDISLKRKREYDDNNIGNEGIPQKKKRKLDRFILNRGQGNTLQPNTMKKKSFSKNRFQLFPHPQYDSYQDMLCKTLYGMSPTELNKQSVFSGNKSLFSSDLVATVPWRSIHHTKKINTINAIQTLDAPNIINNFYTQPLAWASNNVLAVALNDEVYSRNQNTEDIQKIYSLSQDKLSTDEEEENYISAIHFVDNNTLVIGTRDGLIDIFDIAARKRIVSYKPNLNEHRSQITTIASLETNIILFGNRNGTMFTIQQAGDSYRLQQEQEIHEFAVCRIVPSPDQRLIATGGNDNKVTIWKNNGDQWKRICDFNHHKGAVRALAWHPTQTGILASGGGLADHTLRIWRMGDSHNSSKELFKVDLEGQISDLCWSEDGQELAVTIGLREKNTPSIFVFRFDKSRKTLSLTAQGDLLHKWLSMVKSPNQKSIAAIARNEQLCFFTNVFKQKKTNKRNVSQRYQYPINRIR